MSDPVRDPMLPGVVPAPADGAEPMLPLRLKHHQAVFDLLGRPPVYRPEMAAVLNERERTLGITLPEAVREWYLLEWPEEYSYPEQQAIPAERLGRTSEDGRHPDMIVVGLWDGMFSDFVGLADGPDPGMRSCRTADSPPEPWGMTFSGFVLHTVWNGYVREWMSVATSPTDALKEYVEWRWRRHPKFDSYGYSIFGDGQSKWICFGQDNGPRLALCSPTCDGLTGIVEELLPLLPRGGWRGNESTSQRIADDLLN